MKTRRVRVEASTPANTGDSLPVSVDANAYIKTELPRFDYYDWVRCSMAVSNMRA